MNLDQYLMVARGRRGDLGELKHLRRPISGVDNRLHVRRVSLLCREVSPLDDDRLDDAAVAFQPQAQLTLQRGGDVVTSQRLAPRLIPVKLEIEDVIMTRFI